MPTHSHATLGLPSSVLQIPFDLLNADGIIPDQCVKASHAEREYPLQYVGIALAIVANLIVPLGTTLQKVAINTAKKHNEYGEAINERDAPESTAAPEPLSSYGQLTWWAGLGIILGAEMGNMAAYGLAAGVLISPLGTVGLAGNAIYATIILKEPFTHRMAMSVALLSIGVAMIAIGAPAAAGGGFFCDPVSEFYYYFTDRNFIIFSSCMLGLMSVTGVLVYMREKETLFYLVAFSGLAGGFMVMTTKFISSMLFGVCRPCCGDNCFVRDRSALLNSPEFWICTSVMCILGPVQVASLNRAMELFDNQKVIPLFFVIFTIASMSLNAVLYQEIEWKHYAKASGKYEGALFVFGLLICFLGAALLTIEKISLEIGGYEVRISGSGDDPSQPLVSLSPKVPKQTYLSNYDATGKAGRRASEEQAGSV